MHQELRDPDRRGAPPDPLFAIAAGTGDPDGEPAGGRRDLLVCLSHLRWDFVWQRPQHLMLRAARGRVVVLMEEPIWIECEAPHLHVSERPGGIRILVPCLPHGTGPAEAEAAQRRLLDGFLAGEERGRLLLWYYTPMALGFSGHLEPDLLVYDNMDELSGFRGASPEMMANEADLMARADLVFTGGMSLWEAKRDRHPRVSPHPSSIDREHFAVARDWPEPEPADQAGIPGPRIGFFGVMDERLDTGLLDAVALLRPDWSFVMVGPVVKIDPATLPRHPNVHWLGMKSYAELPAYLAGWDAGLMPFARNESTRFISPTKTPEYLAAGVPLVSTPIADVVRPYGENRLVEIAATARGVVGALDRVLARRPARWLARVDRHLAGTSWDMTWGRMDAAMAEALAERDAAGGRPHV